MKIKKIHISTTNSKLGATIPSINLPPITTCRKNAPCYKQCYATKGNFRYNNVLKSLTNNYMVYLENPESYFNQIKGMLIAIPYKHFRFHSSGDIVDMQYFKMMCKLAKEIKTTQFLCFTKKYEIVNEYLSKGLKIPKNLTIVFSNWGLWQCENPFNLPTTWVKFKEETLNKTIPENAVLCSGHCENCFACWNLKKGQSIYFNKH